MQLLDTLKDFFTDRSSVAIVADDPAIMSELLLLVRMMFADGELKGDELAAFRKVCAEGFGIPSDDVTEVMRYVSDFGYETTGKQAAETFGSLPDERKRTLLNHLMTVAVADNRLHQNEMELLRRVADTLGISRDELAQLV